MAQLPKEYNALATNEMVKAICKPLFDSTDICYFHYSKLYDNAKTCILSTHLEFYEYFWKSHQEFFKQYSENIFLNKPTSVLLLNDGIQFGIDRILVIITRYKHYYELFGFGTTPGNDSILNFYLNNMDVLKKFTLYFKEKGDALIKEAEKNFLPVKGYSIKEMKDFSKKKQREPCFDVKLKKIGIQTEFGEVSITARELEILRLIAHGYSGKEMANKLNVVLKTIESHMAHLKLKLGYTRRSDLVECFFKSPYSEI